MFSTEAYLFGVALRTKWQYNSKNLSDPLDLVIVRSFRDKIPFDEVRYNVYSRVDKFTNFTINLSSEGWLSR